MSVTICVITSTGFEAINRIASGAYLDHLGNNRFEHAGIAFQEFETRSPGRCPTPHARITSPNPARSA